MRKLNQIPEDIGESISYDPVEGTFTRIKGSKKKCGCVNNGYLTIEFKGKPYRAHRIAWFLHYGEQPPYIIDHIDRNRSNDKIENLRVVTDSENRSNAPFIGVSKRPSGKFRARIMHNGTRLILGTFDTFEQARAVYRSAKLELHGVTL